MAPQRSNDDPSTRGGQPGDSTMEGWLREDGRFVEIEDFGTHVSPRLGIRFDLTGPELVILRPDGERFLTFRQLADARDAARQENERLRAMLRAAGIDPDQAPPG